MRTHKLACTPRRHDWPRAHAHTIHTHARTTHARTRAPRMHTHTGPHWRCSRDRQGRNLHLFWCRMPVSRILGGLRASGYVPSVKSVSVSQLYSIQMIESRVTPSSFHRDLAQFHFGTEPGVRQQIQRSHAKAACCATVHITQAGWLRRPIRFVRLCCMIKSVCCRRSLPLTRTCCSCGLSPNVILP